MLIYGSVFLISTIFFVLSGYYEKRGNKTITWLFAAIGILIPCIIAGARDESIGTDTKAYGVRYFYYAMKTSSFLGFYEIINTEFLYGFVMYCIARLFKSSFIYLMFQEVVIYILVYKSIKRVSDPQYIWLGMLLFDLLFYSFSLNLIRQMIAISIFMYAFRFIEERKLKSFILCAGIATFIQYTSLIGSFMYPLYWMLEYYSSDKLNMKGNKFIRFFARHKNFVKLITMLVLVILVLNLQKVIEIAMLLTGRYSYQIAHMTDTALGDYRYLLFALPCLFTICLFKKRKPSARIDFMTFIFIASIFLYQCRQITDQAYRISLYFSCFLVILIPEIVAEIRNKGNKFFFSMFNILIWSLYFYYYFIRWLWNLTYPYTSSLLGIN